MSGDQIPEIDEARLERLARLVARLLRGRPLHQGGHLPHPRPAPAGLEFLDHRPWMPGDDPRHLDWRASARCRQPLVRRYRDEHVGEWVICLDRSASMGTAEGVWALARQLTAALAFLLLSLEHRVGLALFSAGLDGFLPPGRGRAAYLGLRRLLACATPRGAGGASCLEACLPRLTPGRQAAILSDFLTPDSMQDALGAMGARCDAVHAFQVYAEKPPALPEGPLDLEDVESGEHLIAGADPTLGSRVQERLRLQRSDLERFCRRRGLIYSACPAGRPWDRVLLAHLVHPEARLA